MIKTDYRPFNPSIFFLKARAEKTAEERTASIDWILSMARPGNSLSLTDAINAFCLYKGDSRAVESLPHRARPICRYTDILDALPPANFSHEEAPARLEAAFPGLPWRGFFSFGLENHPEWARPRLAHAWISRASLLRTEFAAAQRHQNNSQITKRR
jgi:hypothetical protein